MLMSALEGNADIDLTGASLFPAAKPSPAIPAPITLPQKNTYDRTTTFFRQGASSGAVGSMEEVWKDQRETEPSVTES